MVLLNSGPNDYGQLFVFVVDTLSTICLNSGNWFWRKLWNFSKRCCGYFCFWMVHLPIAKNKEYLTTAFRHSDFWPLSCKQLIPGHSVEKRTTLWRMVAKMWSHKICAIFLDHPVEVQKVLTQCKTATNHETQQTKMAQHYFICIWQQPLSGNFWKYPDHQPTESNWLSEQGLTSHQTHYRSYRPSGAGFYSSNDPTNSVTALKDDGS